MLIHFLPQRLDRTLEESLFGDEIFVFNTWVFLAKDLHFLTLVERGWEAILSGAFAIGFNSCLLLASSFRAHWRLLLVVLRGAPHRL